MEIDLELPSHDHEKLDSGLNMNGGSITTSDTMDIAEDEVISPTEHAIDSNGLTADDDVTGNRDHVDKNSNVDDVLVKGAKFEPQNNLIFETKEAAYSLYREYARSVGFGITIKASRRSKKSGKFIDVKIACSRFGNKRESNTATNHRSCTKTDCKAGMHMKRTSDEKWIIHSFVKEHNHEICPDDFVNAIKGRSKQSGVIPCQKKGLQLALDEEDMQSLLGYFTDMKALNPNFFYAIDLNHEMRLRSVFWLDAKGRQDYSIFCDVVFFDTYYLRENYKIPYVPIVGVNHHCQYMLVGCALIGEQTTSNFVWLMQTWLKAVGGQAPSVVVTDHDRFLNEAILQVFPNTRQCYCLWHILSKIPENLCGTTMQSGTFMENFEKCIYQSWTEEQFEKRWWKMAEKYALRDDDWFKSLHEHRKKWVPTYMHDVLLAGISTTDRSRSITSFFDSYIGKEAAFEDFMEQYTRFLHERGEMEVKADIETRNRQPTLRSHSVIEKQMSAIYTDAIFKKFQLEVSGVTSCHLQRQTEDETTVNFQIDDLEEQQIFCVSWNETASHICCSCRCYEYKGFLCKHAIFVLQMSGISDIPSRYILKRWTKYAKISQTVTEVPRGRHYRVQRFNDLCKRVIKLGEQGSLSQEAYDIALQALEEALVNCAGANNTVRTVSEPSTFTAYGFFATEEANGSNVTKSKKKKMYQTKKVRAELDRTTIGLQESCEQVEQMNSRARSSCNFYVPEQHDVREMDLPSRAPPLHGYYGSQQSLQGMGQLDSISPIRTSYFGNQHGLTGMGQIHSMPTRINQFGNQQNGLGQLGFREPTLQSCFDIDDHDSL